MSPSAAAPRTASAIACVRTSASECPSNPRWCSIGTPPTTSARPSANWCVSQPRPVRTNQPACHPIGSMRALAALELRELGDAVLAQQLDGRLVAVTDIHRLVRVRRQRELQPGVEAHVDERRRRVDLADRLAQAGRRHLDGHAGLGERLDRGLVEEAQVGVRQRPLLAPVLHEIGVGHDVVEAGARGVGERQEVLASRCPRAQSARARCRRCPCRALPASGSAPSRSRSPTRARPSTSSIWSSRPAT